MTVCRASSCEPFKKERSEAAEEQEDTREVVMKREKIMQGKKHRERVEREEGGETFSSCQIGFQK